MPIQASRSNAIGQVEVFEEFVPGLKDVDQLSHLLLVYVFHASDGYTLHVQPFLDDQQRGLFATRYPARPNQIGLSVVRLLNIEGNMLEIASVDVLDGTPLLDIKPHIPEFDVRQNVCTGWYAARSRE